MRYFIRDLDTLRVGAAGMKDGRNGSMVALQTSGMQVINIHRDKQSLCFQMNGPNPSASRPLRRWKHLLDSHNRQQFPDMRSSGIVL